MEPEGNVGIFRHSQPFAMLFLYFAKVIIITISCVTGETALYNEKNNSVLLKLSVPSSSQDNGEYNVLVIGMCIHGGNA
jgi:hypothetical protein